MTNIENKHYPLDMYNNFTPAQKAKHWQLRSPGTTPGRGPTKSTKTSAGAAASVSVTEFDSVVSFAVTAISELMAATKKRTAADEAASADDDKWGCVRSVNHENPTLARQKKENETKDMTPQP